MKRIAFVLSVFIVATCFTHQAQAQQPIAIEVILGTRPPAPNEMNLMQVEERRHPNITKAMHDIENAMHALHDAPDDFGGHKGQAEADLKQSWISLRKALYFRLYRDTH
jgi:hypothetical protein